MGGLNPVLRSVDRKEYENKEGIVYLNGEDMNERILKRDNPLLIVICPLNQPPCKG